jgi:lipoprotein-anchoring transpeptidase ErfK/SrfK
MPIEPNTVRYIEISLPEQRLKLCQGSQVLLDVPVSSARKGPGEAYGSECTPRGWHLIRAKIGTGSPPNTVFVRRRPTGEVYSRTLRLKSPGRDWILSRILWLSGLELGKNRLGPVDTMRRFIYIHGCPDDEAIGIPLSHGCIRMRNHHIIELFDRVRPGTRVFIRA